MVPNFKRALSGDLKRCGSEVTLRYKTMEAELGRGETIYKRLENQGSRKASSLFLFSLG